MKRISAEAIEELVSRFNNHSLPKSQWNHQAHILVGLWHHREYDFDTALDFVKAKIKNYNTVVGTLNTEDAGYHETLTIFWMILTKRYLLRHPDWSFAGACNHFLQSSYASKHYPFEYYSKENLFSKTARKRWINGDIQKISLHSTEYKLNNHFDLSDAQFEQEFNNCTLAPALFNHEAHLRLAWIHIKNLGLESAIKTTCNQILHYVDHLGVGSKYNQTLTVAAIRIVHHFMQRYDIDNFLDFILTFPGLKKGFKGLVSAHYSFDIFNSEKAKKVYMEPDLLPFE